MKEYEHKVQQASQTMETGKAEEAIALYREAIQLDPHRPEAYYNLALVYHRQGKQDEAIANFEKSAEIFPNDASVFNNLGVLYYSRDELEKAEENFRKAIHVEGDHIDALYALGKVYKKRAEAGDPQALEQLERYKDEAKKRMESLYGENNVQKACDLAEKLAKLCPDDAEIHNDYAVLCHQLSRSEEARKAIDRAIELAPDDKDIQGNYELIHETVVQEPETHDNSAGLKVLYVDALSTPSARCCINGITKAYSKVSDLRTFDYRGLAEKHGVQRMNEMLLQAALEFRPDLIHMGKSESVFGATIREIKKRIDTYVVYAYGDFRWQLEPSVIDISQNVDCTLFQTTDQEVLDRYRADGAGNIGGFMALGTDPDIFYPRDVEKDKDIVFMGINWHFQSADENEYDGYPKRRQLIEEALKKELNVHVYGANWEYLLEAGYKTLHIHPFVVEREFAQACSSARITLGINAVNNVRMYASWRRTLNCMACGAFHLTHYVPDMETRFHNREHLVWFKSVPEAMELIEYYLTHENEREAIAKAGREIALARHTWDHFVADVISRRKKAKSETPQQKISSSSPNTENSVNMAEADQNWRRNFQKILMDPALKGKVIDIGAKHGALAFRLAEQYDVTAVDIDPECVKVMKTLAEQKGLDIPIYEAAIESLPFEDDSFDAIILSQVLEHVRNPKDLGELMRIMKPSGALIITTNLGFAHWDPDHCWFFLPRDIFKVLYYGWFFMREQNQRYAFLKCHNVAPFEDFIQEHLSQWFEYQQFELRQSRWDSLELYARVYKTQQTHPFPVLEGEALWREIKSNAMKEPVLASSRIDS